jgi:hypothetical protein
MYQVYRLITRKTYEAVMFEKASMKLGLEQAVLGRARDKGPSKVRPFFPTSKGVSTLIFCFGCAG